jgi:competence protein ComEC
VALVFLAVEPRQLYDASFLLSVLAVAALGVISDREGAPGAERRRRLARAAAGVRLAQWAEFFQAVLRLPGSAARSGVRFASSIGSWTGSTVVLSLFVQIGLTLPMVYFFHRLSATAVAANIAVGALTSLAIPVALLSLVTGWHWSGSVAALLLDWTRRSAEVFAAWEPAWRIPDPPLWLAAALAAATVIAAFCYRARSRWAGPAAAVLSLPLALVILYPFAPRVWKGWLELTAIDVGQGESLLLCPPAGDPMLVDGGGLPARVRTAASKLDVGEDVVAPYLWRRGIRRLSVIVVTHLHEDHAQGVPALIEDFRPREVWTGFAPRHPAWLAIERSARAAGARVRILRAGDRLESGGASIAVLAPSPDQQWTGQPRNNDSLVLRVTHGGHSMLLTGDADHLVEESLLETPGLGRATVLKAAHHGSRGSSTVPFLDFIQPAFAVVSAGRGNHFGLPARATLDRFAERHATVLRTDKDGLATIRTDGSRFAIERPNTAVEPWELLGLD